MQVTLDQQPCDVAASTVWDAIAEASAIAQANGRMIIEVVVDGTPIGESDMSALQREARGASSVELTSANVTALVAEVFAEAEESLTQAEALQIQAAQKLETGAQVDAMTTLSEAVTIWQTAQRALVLGMEAMNECGRDVKEKSFDDAVHQLREQLDGVCDSLRQQDMIALSDALMYELPACIAQWRAMLQALRQQALGEEQKS